MNNEQYFNSNMIPDNLQKPYSSLKLGREIHPTVRLGRNVTLGMHCILEEGVVVGDNCFIGHHVLVRPYSKIGNGVGIRSFCLLDPEVEIGDRTQVYPHATVGGGTILGRDVYYGPYTLTTNSSTPGVIEPPIINDGAIIYAGCMIGPGVVIGSRAIIGLGSVLLSSVPAGELWYGDAAKFKRQVTKEDHGLDKESPWPDVILEYHEELNELNKRNLG